MSSYDHKFGLLINGFHCLQKSKIVNFHFGVALWPVLNHFWLAFCNITHAISAIFYHMCVDALLISHFYDSLSVSILDAFDCF